MEILKDQLGIVYSREIVLPVIMGMVWTRDYISFFIVFFRLFFFVSGHRVKKEGWGSDSPSWPWLKIGFKCSNIVIFPQHILSFLVWVQLSDLWSTLFLLCLHLLLCLSLVITFPSCEPGSLLKFPGRKAELLLEFLYSFLYLQLCLSPVHFSYCSQICLFTENSTLFSLVDHIPLLSR